MKRTGVYVAAAFICDGFEERLDAGGYNVEGMHFNAIYTLPDQMGVITKMVIIVCAGAGSPSARIRVVGYMPDGPKHEFPEVLHRFSGSGICHNIEIEIPIAPVEGTFWFDVLVNGIVQTSVPFNVTRLAPSADA